MLRKFALVLVAGATVAAGTALAPTEASAWYRCWRCGPYGYYGGPVYYYPRYYVVRRPVFVYYGWGPIYRPYWGWRPYW